MVKWHTEEQNTIRFVWSSGIVYSGMSGILCSGIGGIVWTGLYTKRKDLLVLNIRFAVCVIR